MSGFMQWNIDVLYALAGIRSDFLTVVMRFFTLFGEETMATVLLCFLYWCVNKRLAYGIGFATFVSGAVVQGLKIAFQVPRPWNLDPLFAAVAAEQQKVLSSFSFPSGHTQGAASLFGTLGFALKNKAAKIVCFLIVALVGFSRMYLGVHTPLDVVTSWVLVLLLAFLCAKLLTGQPIHRRDVAMTVLVLALGAALLALALSLRAAGTIEHRYTADSCKQAGAAIGFALGAYIERRHIRFDVRTRRWWNQLVKYVCGIAGVLLIKEGLKPVFALLGTDILAGTLRYFLMVLWMTALYPLIIRAVSGRFAGETCEKDGGAAA